MSGEKGETGTDAFGWRMRWYSTRVLPPVVGIGGLVDMVFLRQDGVQMWRVFVCLLLIGRISAVRATDLIGGGGPR